MQVKNTPVNRHRNCQFSCAIALMPNITVSKLKKVAGFRLIAKQSEFHLAFLTRMLFLIKGFEQ
jgi:hypothetical protein